MALTSSPTKRNFIKTIKVMDLDTKEHIFNIGMWTTNENHYRYYIAATLSGKEINKRVYMEHVTIIEVTAAFRKHIRNNRINLNRL